MSNLIEFAKLCGARGWEMQIVQLGKCWIIRAVSYQSLDSNAFGIGDGTPQVFADSQEFDLESLAGVAITQLNTIDAFRSRDEEAFRRLTGIEFPRCLG